MLTKLVGDLWTAVELAGLIIDFLDLLRPFLVLALPMALGMPLPFVISAAGYVQNIAHLLQPVLEAVFVDERIFYRWSFAKKCILNFRCVKCTFYTTGQLKSF
ncbi:hypothetical protein P4S91_10025 [Aneurinibacillus aneurinilyticus]|uniref:hypothetical protein n=1 Tax=Aneurinibacillus aneurinilyticus TaxID=1391 RepID=UPI000590847F|nr:hypothetical protein [Aneurinibacillus aneurinilyticus]MED0707574.1 hypothetical protein [Aneurinibacillus aneurinilyticus]MED0723252.1 hypothetical protein [Aneurinibacillus aneurinilyticus]MED0732926.1 hypothetical protein [Aneurinibacillus aneurinilyticus]